MADESSTTANGEQRRPFLTRKHSASIDNDSELGRNVYVSTHPVVRHKLSILRSITTPPTTFRAVLREITYHLGYEATCHLNVAPIPISVPVPGVPPLRSSEQNTASPTPTMTSMDYTGYRINDQIALIPILRSGLGMIESMLELLPMASIHHIGMYKVAGQHPVQYYNRLPKMCQSDVAYILDPVIATSSTILSVIRIIKKVRLTIDS
jgi:uracil phosphoribosyltransferase